MFVVRIRVLAVVVVVVVVVVLVLVLAVSWGTGGVVHSSSCIAVVLRP